MPRPTQQRKIVNETTEIAVQPKVEYTNLNLIAWMSQLYGIFWGTWLAIFSDKLVSCTTPILFNIDLTLYYTYIIIGFGLLVFIYSYFLIRWMWSVRIISPRTSVATVLNKCKKALVFNLITILGIITLGTACNNVLSAYIGSFITGGWIVALVIIVISDKRDWN